MTPHLSPTRIIIDRKNRRISIPIEVMQRHTRTIIHLHKQIDELWKQLDTLIGDMPI